MQEPDKQLQETALRLAETLEISFPPAVDAELLEELVAQRLEVLISRNFQQFVLLLYRMDVAENQVRRILEDDAGPGAYRRIAALLIAKQQQKIKQDPADWQDC